MYDKAYALSDEEIKALISSKAMRDQWVSFHKEHCPSLVQASTLCGNYQFDEKEILKVFICVALGKLVPELGGPPRLDEIMDIIDMDYLP